MRRSGQLYPGLVCAGGRLLVAVVALVVLLAAGGQLAAADPVGQISEFQGSGGSAISSGPDGNLWFAETGAIGRITPDGQLTEFSTGLTPGSVASDITSGPDGNLWFTDRGTTKAIGRITRDGQITEFSTGLSAGSLPWSITSGPDGNLWFVDRGKPAIGRITPAGDITEFSTGLPSGSNPLGITQGPDGNLWFTDPGTRAIGRITTDGQSITEFSAGLNPGSYPGSIRPGPDGNLWFTDVNNSAIGRITTLGMITEFSAAVPPNGVFSITPGPDGNMWFGYENPPPVTGPPPIGRITPSGQISYINGARGTAQGVDALGADGNVWFVDGGAESAFTGIGRIGTGTRAAVQAPPTLAGDGQVGRPEICQDGQWQRWAGVSPSASVYSFDGYQWLSDGAPIPGATSESYTPTADDAGHQLACRITVTYPLPFLVTAPAVSASMTLPPNPTTMTTPTTAPATTPPASASTRQPITRPALRGLRVRPTRVLLTGRRAGGRCVPVTPANHDDRSCVRLLRLRITYTLTMAANVTFAIERLGPGRIVKGKCMAPARTNHRHRRCVRWSRVSGEILSHAAAGADSFLFAGRIDRHKLRPGTYRLIAIPAVGPLDGIRRTATFRIKL